MKLLQIILVVVLSLTPFSQAYAGQFLHGADCGAAESVKTSSMLDHAGHGPASAHHDAVASANAHEAHAANNGAPAGHDCECGCPCGVGHACQGGAGLPVSAADAPVQRTRVIAVESDNCLPSPVPADDLRPPIPLDS